MKSEINKNNILPNSVLARKRLIKANIIRDAYIKNEAMKDFGLGKTFHIRTYGCQSNVRDTETFKGICFDMNYTWTDDIMEADLVILNTCAIRENAEKKVFGEIGLLKSSKDRNPNMLLGISGCMSQSVKVVNTILTRFQYVDFVIGTHNIHDLANIIEKVKFDKQQIIEVWSKEGDVIENLPIVRNNSIKAWVNVMFGCDKFCTYCIVPFTRGKIRSRQLKDILKEVNSLKADGFKELTLLGQNVNSYGIDLDEGTDFALLLEEVAKTGIERVRFTTSNPWNWNDKVIAICEKYDNIMPYFHLPIQSGSEEILTKMNRKMKIETYIDLVAKIRSRIKNVAISTDLIVGFPNETEEQFEKTLKLYHQIKFDNSYTFIYSKRENTPAALIEDFVDLETKKKRLAKLNELVKLYSAENNKKYVTKTLLILVEGPSKSNPTKLSGYSPQWKVVNFSGNAKAGEIVQVKIDSASRFSLNGTQI